MKRKINLKSVISLLLSVAMLMSVAPVTTFAAQSNEYVDPADNWLNSNGRTNELDVNATTTYETQYCCACDKDTTVLTYRVPEYTRSGTTALNRDVRYSDGTKNDGESQGIPIVVHRELMRIILRITIRKVYVSSVVQSIR